MNFKYKVEFDNGHSTRVIGNANDMETCWKIINDFMDERNYMSYYQRVTLLDNKLWIDVGSHTRFFYMSRYDGKSMEEEFYGK